MSESANFEDLVTSRKQWIEDVLRPWCRSARRMELLKAENEWQDIAGRAAAEQTLWAWAWERFPALVYDGLTGVNETRKVIVTFQDGETITGYPEGRQSQRGQLVMLVGDETMDSASADQLTESGPFSIDLISSVALADAVNETEPQS